MITRQFDIILNTKILNTLTSNMIVTQNDKDTNILKIKVFDGDSEIDYTQVDHARIFFEKKDKEVIQGDLTKVSDGFTYQMGTNEIACTGEVLTIIHLYGSNNERLGTSKFKFEVERDLENENVIKSSSQYSALETIIVEFREEVSKLQEEVNKIIAEGSTNIPEVVDARHSNIKNKDFNVVGDRLDDIEKNMQNIDMSSQLEPIHDKISILEEANNSQTADLAELKQEIVSEKQATLQLGYPNNVQTINSKVGGSLDVKMDGNMVVNLLGSNGDMTKTKVSPIVIGGNSSNVELLKIKDDWLNCKAGGESGAVGSAIIENLKSGTYFVSCDAKANAPIDVAFVTRLVNYGKDYSATCNLDIYVKRVGMICSIEDGSYNIGMQSINSILVDTKNYMVIKLEGDDLNLSVNELIRKYPYVESAQPVQNPYVRVQGKNLFDSKSRYNVLGAEVRYLSNGVGIKSIVSGTYKCATYSFDLKPNTQYCFSAKSKLISGTSGGYSYVLDDNEKIITGVNTLNPSYSFTTPLNGKVKIFLYATGKLSENGEVEYTDIQLEEGTVATEYKPHKEAIGIIPDYFAKIGDNKDKVIGLKGTKAVADRRIERVKLDAEVAYLMGVKLETSTVIRVMLPNNMINRYESNLKKYDGKIIPCEQSDTVSNFSSNDGFITYLSDKNMVVLNIPNVDTGWGDSYTPTTEEIKAYFMGWKMYATKSLQTLIPSSTQYNGEGIKAWVKVWNGKGEYSEGTGGVLGTAISTLPTESYPEWTPYELFYVLETPRREEIEMNIIGDSFSLQEGINTVEVGTGLVYEKATVGQYTSFYEINTTLVPKTRFRYKAENIIDIYKNKSNLLKIDNQNWVFDTGKGTGKDCWGNMRLYQNIDDNLFDPQSEYYCLYEMIPELYTCQPENAEIVYSENMRDSLNNANKRIGELSGDVSQINKEMLSKLQVPEGYRMEIVDVDLTSSTSVNRVSKTVVFNKPYSEKPIIVGMLYNTLFFGGYTVLVGGNNVTTTSCDFFAITSTNTNFASSETKKFKCIVLGR